MVPDFYHERGSSRYADETVVEELCRDMRHVASGSSDQSVAGSSRLPARFAFGGELGDLLLEHLQEDANSATLSAKFRLYYRLRSFVPIFLRQLLQRGRNRNLEVSERWYLPDSFVERFKTVLSRQDSGSFVIHPWPDDYQLASVLTHDVETADGLRNVLKLAELEDEFGLKSCWNLIPHKYPIDPGIVRELKHRGHEVGVHGFNHDGRLFESRETFRNRVPSINDAIDRYNSQGFRAPMVHRNLLWLQELNVDYDASCFDVDPFQAMPGGVGGVWPFFAGKFVELPYTLPQDHTLFVALGQETPDIWIEKFEWLASMRGMALLVTHPDYLNTPRRLDAYREFLEYVVGQRERAWLTLPADVAHWWRQRDGMEVVYSDDEQPHIVGSASERATLLSMRDLFPQLFQSQLRVSSQREDSHC